MQKITLQKGDKIGNYEVVKTIGSGAFGDVYLAQHEWLPGKKVAIKVINAQTLTAEDVVEFIKEAIKVSNFKHPNILEIIDCSLLPVPHIITPYCARGTLESKYPLGTVVHAKAVAYNIKQIAQALWYMHQRDMMHIDIKPANILIGENDEMLLTDFGIATYRSSNQYAIKGTLPYIAPEVWKGHPSAASDQYSLAILTYELLSGKPPFLADDRLVESDYRAAIANLHLHEAPPTLGEHVSPDVEVVVLKALAKDPVDRYHNILKFAEALEEAFEKTTISTGFYPPKAPDKPKTLIPSPISPPPTPSKKKSLPAIVIALLLILAIYLLVVNVGRPGIATPKTQIVPTPSPLSQNPYTHSGTLVLDDPLSDNNEGHDWLTGTNERGATCEFRGGVYHTTQPAHGLFHACGARNTDFRNFVFEVEMTLVAGDYAGIIFRKASDDAYYLFHLATDGTYDLRLYSQPGSEGQSLIKGSISINLYQENLIAVIANQGSITMYVNHQLIGSFNDNTLTHGQIAILVGNNTVDLAEATFRDAKIWAL